MFLNKQTHWNTQALSSLVKTDSSQDLDRYDQLKTGSFLQMLNESSSPSSVVANVFKTSDPNSFMVTFWKVLKSYRKANIFSITQSHRFLLQVTQRLIWQKCFLRFSNREPGRSEIAYPALTHYFEYIETWQVQHVKRNKNLHTFKCHVPWLNLAF